MSKRPAKNSKKSKPRRSAESGSEYWIEYLDFCNKAALSNWWFRGECDASFELIPKIGREFKDRLWTRKIGSGVPPAIYEKRVFEAFKRRANLDVALRPESEFEWLALAQHHGAPTRLLDWTTNPLMAAWFALDCQAPADDQVARIYAVKVTSEFVKDHEEISPFSVKGDNPCFVIAPHWHPRVRAQRGCFTIQRTPNKPLDLTSLTHKEFSIPVKHWRAFRRRLFYFGIDASTVRLDLAGLGEALSWQLRARVGVAAVGY